MINEFGTSPGNLLRSVVLAGIFLACNVFSALNAQDINLRLEIATHMNTAQDVVSGASKLYAATSGGLLIYDAPENSLEKRTALDGIYDHNITALDFSEERQRLILGSLSGNLTVMTPDGEVLSNDQNLIGIEIVDIEVKADTLWVLSSNFISVYLFSETLDRFQFRESYGDFGTVVGGFSNMALANNRIWLAGDAGLISAPSNFLAVNLFAEANWRTQTTADGLPNDRVNDIAYHDQENQLYLAFDQGLYRYDFNAFAITAGNRVQRLAIQNNQLLAANESSVFRRNQGGALETMLSSNFQPISCIALDRNDQAWAGITKKGLRNIDSGESLWSDGPLDNYIGEMLFDSNGRLWCSSGLIKDERKQGVFVLDDNGWQNYVFSGGPNNSYIFMNSSMALHEDSEQNIWVGAWGGGISIFSADLSIQTINTLANPGIIWHSAPDKDDTLVIQTSAQLQSILSPVGANPNYSVITDIISDPQNQSIWILNSAAVSNRALLQYKNSAFNQSAFDPQNWQSYLNPLGDREWFEASFDAFGDLWLAIGTSRGGVTQARLQGDEFAAQRFTENNNLKSNGVRCIATDRDGYIWVGTNSGLSGILSGTIFDFRENFQPIGLIINDIYVDRAGNKWFATNKGLSVLLATGSPFDPASWIDVIPLNSSIDPEQQAVRTNLFKANLPSEVIHSVVMDNNTSDVYLGTNAGIAILRNNPFASSFETYEQLKSGPNPLILTDGETTNYYFNNLVSGSEVKILTLSGQLVRTLSATNFDEVRGNQARWNGLNQDGKKVSSGVYLFLVISETGQSAGGKILVIRK